MSRCVVLLMITLATPAWSGVDAPPLAARRPARPAGRTLAELVSLGPTQTELPRDIQRAGEANAALEPPPPPARRAPSATGGSLTAQTTASPVSPPPFSGTAVAAVAVLAAAAACLWWRQRKATQAAGSTLQVREALSLSPRRQLLIVDVGQRSVLLASTEAGIAMLLEYPATAVPPTPFSDELSRVLDAGPRRDMPASTAIGAAGGNAEAAEIIRRLGARA